MKVQEILDQIEADGWILVRMKGSHRVYRHSKKPGIVVVPGNLGKDVPTGTAAAILKQAGLKK